MSTRIGPREAFEKVSEGYTYVDVRSEPEFEAGHPRGALNVPLLHAGPSGMVPNPEFVAVMEKLFPPDAKLVVGCKAGGRSARAVEALRTLGFTALLDQRAGWDGARDPFGRVLEGGWSQEGLPTASGSEEGASYAALRAKAAL